MTAATTNQNVNISASVDFSAFKTANQQFKDMIGNLSGVSKAAAIASKAFSEFSKTKTTLQGVVGQISSLVGASLGLKSSLELFNKYNKEIILLGASFRKYGYDIKNIERSLVGLSKQLGITRLDTLALYKAYERGFIQVSLKGAEKILTNIVNVTGANVEAVGTLQSALADLVQIYPDIQDAVEKLDEADQSRLLTDIATAQITGKLSQAQARLLMEYAAQKPYSDEENKLVEARKEQVKSLEDMKRLWQEIGLVVGQAALPYFEKLSSFLKEWEPYLSAASVIITNVVIPLSVVSGLFKVISSTSSMLGIELAACVGPLSAIAGVTAVIVALGYEDYKIAKDIRDLTFQRAGEEAVLAGRGEKISENYEKQAETLKDSIDPLKKIQAERFKIAAAMQTQQSRAAKGKGMFWDTSSSKDAEKRLIELRQRMRELSKEQDKLNAPKFQANREQQKAQRDAAETEKKNIQAEAQAMTELANRGTEAKAQLEAQTGERESQLALTSALADKAYFLGTGEEETSNALKAQSKLVKDISQERLAALADLTVKEELYKKAKSGPGGERSQAALGALKAVNDAQTKVVQKTKEAADASFIWLNELDKIRETYAGMASSSAGFFSASLDQAKLLGNVDQVTILEDMRDTLADIEGQRASINEELEKAQGLYDKAIPGSARQQEISTKIYNLSTAEVKLTRQKNDVVNEYLKKYSQEAALRSAITSKTEAEVSLFDNLVTGLGASVEMRFKAVNAVEKEKEIVEKELNLYKGIEASGQKLTKEQETSRIQAEQKIVDLTAKEAGLLKQIRDGWVSAISAMTIGTGRITKLRISSDENMRQSLQFNKNIRSSLSGATGRPGEGPIGFRTAEQFKASSNGNMEITGSRRGGQGYNPDTGISMDITNQVLNEQRDMVKTVADQVSSSAARMRGKRGGGVGLAAQGQPGAASAAISGTIGSGKSGNLTPSGNLVPGSMSGNNLPSPVGGGGGASIVLTFQINAGTPDEAISIIDQRIREAFKQIKFPRLQ